MRASFERLQLMVVDFDRTEEADPAKAETIAALKRELESLRGGIEELRAGAACWPADTLQAYDRHH